MYTLVRKVAVVSAVSTHPAQLCKCSQMTWMSELLELV